MVECDLAKVEVAGSNPVSRSIRLTLQFAREPQGSLMAGHGLGERPERTVRQSKAD